MALLNRLHDLLDFTGDDERSKAHGLGNVKFDAARGRMIATDGRVAVLAPVEGNSCPDVLLPAAFLRKKLATKAGEKGIEIVGDKKGVTLAGSEPPKPLPGNYPDLFKHLPTVAPNVAWSIAPKYLLRIASYAAAHNAEGIYFGLRARPDDRLGMMSATPGGPDRESAITFHFYPNDDHSLAPVCGFVMPLEDTDVGLVRSGFDKVGSILLSTNATKAEPLPAAPIGTKKRTPAEPKPPKPPKEPKEPKAPKAPREPRAPRDATKAFAGALRTAATKNDAAKITELIAAGVNPDTPDSAGYNALTRAAGRGHVAAVKALLDGKANARYAVAKDGCTPLHLAAANGYLEVVKLLLAAGASAKAKDRAGITPLDDAIEAEHTAIVKLLKAAK